jgi:LysR family transcriptional regulator, nitrogen assimilation regulatory protein
MELRHIKAFVEVATHGSYVRAANALGIAQSALSRQVAALEREVGGRVFHRTGRGVALTELGERVLPQGRALVADVSAFEQAARQPRDRPSGEVTLGLVPVASRTFVARLTAQLRDDYPDIRLRVLEGYSGQVEEWLTSQRVDIAIYNRYRRSRVANSEAILRADTHLIIRSSHPIAKGREVALRALADIPLALPVRPNSLTNLLTGLAAAQHFELDIRLEASSTSLIGETIRASDLATISPAQVFSREIASGEFSAVRIVRPTIEQTTWMSFSAHRALSAAAQIVTRLIRKLATLQREPSPRGRRTANG